MLSLDTLVAEGLLEASELPEPHECTPEMDNEGRAIPADFDAAVRLKEPRIQKAARRLLEDGRVVLSPNVPPGQTPSNPAHVSTHTPSNLPSHAPSPSHNPVPVLGTSLQSSNGGKKTSTRIAASIYLASSIPTPNSATHPALHPHGHGAQGRPRSSSGTRVRPDSGGASAARAARSAAWANAAATEQAAKRTAARCANTEERPAQLAKLSELLMEE